MDTNKDEETPPEELEDFDALNGIVDEFVAEVPGVQKKKCEELKGEHDSIVSTYEELHGESVKIGNACAELGKADLHGPQIQAHVEAIAASLRGRDLSSDEEEVALKINELDLKYATIERLFEEKVLPQIQASGEEVDLALEKELFVAKILGNPQARQKLGINDLLEKIRVMGEEIVLSSEVIEGHLLHQAKTKAKALHAIDVPEQTEREKLENRLISLAELEGEVSDENLKEIRGSRLMAQIIGCIENREASERGILTALYAKDLAYGSLVQDDLDFHSQETPLNDIKELAAGMIGLHGSDGAANSIFSYTLSEMAIKGQLDDFPEAKEAVLDFTGLKRNFKNYQEIITPELEAAVKAKEAETMRDLLPAITAVVDMERLVPLEEYGLVKNPQGCLESTLEGSEAVNELSAEMYEDRLAAEGAKIKESKASEIEEKRAANAKEKNGRIFGEWGEKSGSLITNKNARGVPRRDRIRYEYGRDADLNNGSLLSRIDGHVEVLTAFEDVFESLVVKQKRNKKTMDGRKFKKSLPKIVKLLLQKEKPLTSSKRMKVSDDLSELIEELGLEDGELKNVRAYTSQHDQGSIDRLNGYSPTPAVEKAFERICAENGVDGKVSENLKGGWLNSYEDSKYLKIVLGAIETADYENEMQMLRKNAQKVYAGLQELKQELAKEMEGTNTQLHPDQRTQLPEGMETSNFMRLLTTEESEDADTQ